MKLLLDENLPVKLKHRFRDRDINAFTVSDQKWNAKQNGELLQLMLDEGFTHLLTFDSNISFQQNFLRYPLPVVVIIAPSNDYATIMEIFDLIVSCINTAGIGANLVPHPSKDTK